MTKLLIGYSVLALFLLLLTPTTAFSSSSVIPTLTDRQAAHVLDDMTTSIHIILGTDSDATRQFNIEKLAGIIENITGYKEDISVSMASNGLNIRIDPDPDGTSTNDDSSSARLVQDRCSNQPGSARMTFPYENRTDCEVEQWIECIENSGTIRWDQLHCEDLKKLFEDPRIPPPTPTPSPNNNTKPPVAGALLTPTPTPPPTPTDYCAGGAMRSPDYDEVCGTGEGEEGEKPLPPIGEDTSEDTANDEDIGDDQPRFGGDQFFDEADEDNNSGGDSDSNDNGEDSSEAEGESEFN